MNRKELTFTHQIRPPHFIAVDEAEEAEARGRHQSHAVLGRVALGEEWLQDVECKGEGLDGRRAGTHYHTPGERASVDREIVNSSRGHHMLILIC